MNSFEAKIIEAIQTLSSSFLDSFFKIITWCAEFYAVVIICALVLVFFNYHAAVKYAFVLGMSVLTGAMLKLIIARPRPINASDEIIQKVSVGNFSFPSNHTLTVAVTAIAVYMLLRGRVRSAGGRAAIATALSVMVALVGLSRVYLGVHYPSDIIAAAGLSVLFYYIFSLLYERTFARTKFLANGAQPKAPKSALGITISNSVQDTARLARRFAEMLKCNSFAVILYDAPMGAGKTTFTRLVVECLNSAKTAEVSSPTFTIINQYADNIYHADLYRIEDERELLNTDFYQIISSDNKNFVFIEWHEKAGNLMKELHGNSYLVKIENMGENARKFIISEVNRETI